MCTTTWSKLLRVTDLRICTGWLYLVYRNAELVEEALALVARLQQLCASNRERNIRTAKGVNEASKTNSIPYDLLIVQILMGTASEENGPICSFAGVVAKSISSTW